MKPANIFLTLNEDIKIGDFGMAEIRSGTLKEEPVSVLGTPYYMSPERLLQKPYFPNCDVWSLGCVMYEVSEFFIQNFKIDICGDTTPALWIKNSTKLKTTIQVEKS